MRLLLLADEPAWAALLRECLAPMGDGAVLISAPNWESVSRLFDDDHSAVRISNDGGNTWTALDATPYNTAGFAGGTGFAVGPKGVIARWQR